VALDAIVALNFTRSANWVLTKSDLDLNGVHLFLIDDDEGAMASGGSVWAKRSRRR
jgi:hypothetical protein